MFDTKFKVNFYRDGFLFTKSDFGVALSPAHQPVVDCGGVDFIDFETPEIFFLLRTGGVVHIDFVFGACFFLSFY